MTLACWYVTIHWDENIVLSSAAGGKATKVVCMYLHYRVAVRLMQSRTHTQMHLPMQTTFSIRQQQCNNKLTRASVQSMSRWGASEHLNTAAVKLDQNVDASGVRETPRQPASSSPEFRFLTCPCSELLKLFHLATVKFIGIWCYLVPLTALCASYSEASSVIHGG